ncbi:response regulator [Desulfovibrio aminophilus]|nr:response regulator [Desulfovibrio aminophilus]
MLGRHGDCEAAITGEEALDLFQAALRDGPRFDLVFMDVLLPGMDGLQTLERVRELERRAGIPDGEGARVIVATALDDDQHAARAFFQGRAVSYITKPLSVDSIRNELRGFGFLY